jgi:hypothetical protein
VRDTRGPPTNKLSVYDCIQSCWKYITYIIIPEPKRAKKSTKRRRRRKATRHEEQAKKEKREKEKRAFKSSVKPFFESTCLIDVETERTALMEHGR